MQRWDWLRLSLLAGLTGCAVDGGSDAGSDGQTTTTQGSSASASGGTEAGETGDEVCEFGCEGAVEIAEGIVECPDGRINRVGPGTFDPTINEPSCAGTETNLNCTSDADCSATYSKCISGSVFDEFGETTYCRCATACASDSDCAEGSVCVPPGVLGGTSNWPTCMQVDCATNADCGECGQCGLGAFDDGCGYVQTVQCRTAEDICTSDDDCGAGESCYPLNGPTWGCQYGGCAIGRPLLVDGVACLAAARERDDWAQLPAGIDAIAVDLELAAHWSEIAALEHASVASFARFGAQLLALGAPAALLRDCKRAALDEIEHARLAYGLASAYAGAPVGPGGLSLRGVTIAATWREVVEGLIVEACVGETLGVAEAMSAAESVCVEEIRVVLERVAIDELRHAQLAWRCLGWLLRGAEAEDRKWAMALLERNVAVVGTGDAVGAIDRPHAGVLGGQRRVQLHREAKTNVLMPLVRALAAA